MYFSLPVFVLVLLLGTLQIFVGVVFGRCLPIRARRSAAAGGEIEDLTAEHACQLAGRLYQLVAHVARDVGEHQAQLQQVNEELAAAQLGNRQQVAEFVLHTITHMLEINGRLQSQLGAAEKKLQEQTAEIEAHIAEARTDALTRLPNRRAFDDALPARITQWQRTAAPLHVMLIDVDHFKKFNDRHGHLVGDQVLRKVAEVLRGVLPESDMVARIGGEEFAVILTSGSTGDARRLGEALRAAISTEEFRFENAKFPLTVSLGLASVQAGDDPVSLLRRADDALYAAKRAGRNNAYFHNGQAQQRIPLCDESDNDFQRICLDLRQQVARVIGTP